MKQFLSALLSVLLLHAQTSVPLQAPSDRRPAAPFELRDSKGKRVRLSDYRGKVLLLNFWATWCGGCKQEMPEFEQLAQSFKKRKFTVLGISVDEKGWAEIRPFLKNSKVTYRIALAEKNTPEGYDIQYLPATFLIDQNGQIAARYQGRVDAQDIEANIRLLVESQP